MLESLHLLSNMLGHREYEWSNTFRANEPLNLNPKYNIEPWNTCLIGVFSKWNSVNSANLGNQIHHWSMSWGQLKVPASHICLAGAVVASWSLMQEMAGLNPFTVMTNNFSLNSLKTFRENSIDYETTTL